MNNRERAICDLWHQAFGDDPAEILAFLREVPHIPYLLWEENDLTAMAFAIPQTVGQLPAAYLYAVATDASRRGQGLASRLLSQAEADLKQRGFAAVLLSPASAPLLGWYLRQGYASWGDHAVLSLPSSDAPELSPEDYLSLRESALEQVPHNVPPLAVLAQYRLTACGAWTSDGRPAERLSGDMKSPLPTMVKRFRPDFPVQGYFSFFLA